MTNFEPPLQPLIYLSKGVVVALQNNTNTTTTLIYLSKGLVIALQNKKHHYELWNPITIY